MLAQPGHPLLPTPCSPSPGLGERPGTSPGAGVPQPCSPASTMHARWRLRLSKNSPCSLPPYKKTSRVGCLPPTRSSGAEEGGGANTQVQPTLPGGVAQGTVKKGPPP